MKILELLGLLPRRLGAALLRGYKLLISPLLPQACRFYPTCSEYCREAVLRHGLLRGGWLGLRRLLRCQPFCQGGYDPVPDRSPPPSEALNEEKPAPGETRCTSSF